MSDAPKSAFELAMERLKQKDAEAGVTTKPLTDGQKAAIVEVKSLYDSKIAEQDVLQQSAMQNMAAADPAEVDEISRRFRREKERLAGERDRKLDEIRSRE